MALTRIADDYTGYFDSIEKEKITMPDGTTEYKYDRAKTARFHADAMLSMNTSGISAGITNCFKIIPGSGLSVTRLPGEGWIDGHFAKLMYQQNTTLAENNQVYYYIIRCMSDAENRCMYEGVLVNPDVSKLPVREENTFDLVIAKIEIPAGVAQITEAMITDLRLNKDLCGYMVSNSNPANIIVTADDVTDTDTHMIPVKTGSREKSLRGDGTYGSDLMNSTIGDLKFTVINGEYCLIYNARTPFSWYTTPINYNVVSSSGTSNLSRMLNGTDNTNYAAISGNYSSPAHIRLLLVQNIQNKMDAANIVNGADVTLKIKYATPSASGTITSYYMALWNFTTNTEVSDTRRNITANTSPTIETFTYHFNSYSELFDIGIVVYMAVAFGMTPMPERSMYIYGADATLKYDLPYTMLMKFTPYNVTAYDYTNGTAAVMGMQMQAITETPLEGQKEQSTVTFSEPYEDTPPHGTTPETALSYVKSVYMSGEYMIYDGKVYKCVEDNAVNPPSVAAVAHKWELIEDAD